MNNMTEYSPLGSVTYNRLDDVQFEDSQGNMRDIPQWERTVALSDDQQAILDAQNQASQSLLGIANDQLGFLGDYLGHGINTDGMQDWGQIAQAPNFNTQMLEASQMGQIGGAQSMGTVTGPGPFVYGPESAPQLNSNLALNMGPQGTPQLNNSLALNMGPQGTPTLNNSVDLNTDFDVGSIPIQGGGSMNVERADGTIAGVGEGIQQGVYLSTQGGQTGGIVNTFDGQQTDGTIANAGNIQNNLDLSNVDPNLNYAGPGYQFDSGQQAYTGDIADAGSITNNVNLNDIQTNLGYNGPSIQGNVNLNDYNGSIASAGAIQRQMPVDDYSADRTRVEDAIMSRYNRQFAETESALDQKLRNQGLMPGTEAYDRQFRQMREMQNDAVMQSILAGGQEQSRLFGLDLASGQFANQAQAQQFGQNQATSAFDFAVNQANNQNAMNAAQFNNSASNQAFLQALQSAEFQRAGENQNNANMLLEGNFNNAAQAQQFAQNQARGMFGLNVNAQNNQTAISNAQFANQASTDAFSRAVQEGQYGREGTAFNNAAAIQNAQFANAAQAQQFGQNQAQQQANASAVAQNNALSQAQAAFANAAQSQNFQQTLANAGFSNDQVLAMANFANAAQQQGFSQREAQTMAMINATSANNTANYQSANIASQNAANANQAAIAMAGLNLQAQQAENEAIMQEANFSNSALQQDFANQMQLAGFGNQSALQQAQFNNAASQQDFANQMQLAGFGNQSALQQAQFNNAASQQDFANQMQLAGFGNQSALQQAQFNNAASQQDFANQMQLAGFGNQSALQQAQFNNSALQQDFTNQMGLAQFQNQTTQDILGANIAATQFNNAASQQDFANQLQQMQFNNSASTQDLQNQMAIQQQYNQILGQQYNADLSQSQQEAAMRQQQLAEQFALHNQPINEITSLMSGSQLMMPQFAPAFQTGLQPVPVADYMQQAYENEVAASNASASGLFGILGAGMSLFGGLSDRRTKRDIRRLGSLPNGIPVYEFRYIGMDDPQVGVMADEVEHIPDAVNVVGGLKMVNYGEVISHAG